MTPTQLHLFNALRCIYKYGKGQSFRWHFRFVIRARKRGWKMTLDSEKLVALYFYYTNEPMSARRWMQILSSDLRKK